VTSVPGSSLQGFLAETRDAVNRALEAWGARAEAEVGGAVGAAMRYGLAAPGKRFRPALAVAAYRELGGRGDPTELAAAIEVIHTYSLMHDDLPCMDDDDLRRGRPTAHRRFGVPAATEAAFRLVPLAARVLAAGARRLGVDRETLAGMGAELFRAAGASGMIGGQVLDLEAEGGTPPADALVRIHRLKTGALIVASAAVGAVAANAPADRVAAVRRYAEEVGLAFQIVDDVLDATASSDELGKTPGKDVEQRKATYAAALGVDGAREAAAGHVARAVDQLGASGIDSPLLADLAQLALERRS
jgi:geranylgeranyl pyrophosphate synthase